MRKLLLMSLVLTLILALGTVFASNKAYYTGSDNPTLNLSPSSTLPLQDKDGSNTTAPPNSGVILEGGEDISSAVVIPSLPFYDEGYTCDNQDNYDEICPYDGTGSPDVVYSYTPGTNQSISISLCDSSDYDTKVYVYDIPNPTYQSGLSIACNDDACSTPNYPDAYVSRIYNVNMTSGTTYYIVVDGYDDLACGNYSINVELVSQCVVECPGGGTPEGEPDCYDDYIDSTNGGCNSEPPVFGSISPDEVICGTSGNYVAGGNNSRDTDWFEFSVTEDKIYKITACAEFPIVTGFLVPGEDNPAEPCSVSTISNSVLGAPCDTVESTMFLTTGNFGYYWVFVSTQDFSGTPCGSNYWVKLEEFSPPADQEYGLATTAQIPDCGVSNYGPLGDQDYQGNTYGWNGNPPVNYGGTFVMGNSDTTAFAYYGPDQSNCLHVRPAGPLNMSDTYHPYSNYDDNGYMGGIAVNYCGHGFETAGSDSGDIFVHVFTISNEGASTVSDLYAGIYFDWDVNTTKDTVIIDGANKLIYMGSPTATLRYGAALVNSVPLSTLTGVSQWDYIYPTGPSGGGWNQDDLYALMSSGINQIADSFYTDMSMLLSTGPYSLAPGDTVDVEIAVIGANSNADMVSRAQLAQTFDIPRCVITAPAGCPYVPGDVNGSDSYNGLDITYGVAFFKGGPDPLCNACPIPECQDWSYCGDVNGSCSYNGLDITYGVAYFKGGPGPIYCTDCPPEE